MTWSATPTWCSAARTRWQQHSGEHPSPSHALRPRSLSALAFRDGMEVSQCHASSADFCYAPDSTATSGVKHCVMRALFEVDHVKALRPKTSFLGCCKLPKVAADAVQLRALLLGSALSEMPSKFDPRFPK